MSRRIKASEGRPKFESEPTLAFCPVCNEKVVTHVELETGKFAQLWAMILCLLGGCFGCCFLPFYLRGFSDATHTCPRCGTEDIQITAVDQGRINSFAKWNVRLKEYEAEKLLQNLVDLEDELLVSESEVHPFKIGESFFHLPTEEVNEKVDEQKAQLKDRLVTLESELSDCKATMATLKKELYAKFGGNINLEDC
ncbi:Prefoldin subunit 4 [Echinococcus granulosus]|uniref:Prefoldin subunit 4 n=1 Tax=Echinococcus granulosus TaxID=6210 RepID=A0A068WL62_ECHGR|nr:Prefoldin subunit 4 [Echinococcus granulosus]CDS19208.1 prefoldin subunit 4 [Echinococcus granulosus]